MKAELWIIAVLVLALMGTTATMLFIKNLLNMALLLLVSMLLLAALYALLYLPFLAITQIVIYVGGILVLVLFSILLSKTKRGSAFPVPVFNKGFIIFTLILGFSSLIYLGYKNIADFKATVAEVENEAVPIANNLLREGLLPFELAGIFLLVVLILSTSLANYRKA